MYCIFYLISYLFFEVNVSMLSIIVPVYNVGCLVKRCLESLINQSFFDMEIIVINDGSIDDSYKYIEQFLCNNKIRYIEKQNNEGLGQARNTGIENAKGDYIAFVDSDDWVDLDMYKVLLDSIEENQADIAICGVKNESNNYICSKDRYTYEFANQISGKKALSLLSRSECNNYMISPVVWNKIYKKKLIVNNKINFLPNSYWEDDIFSFQVFMNANCINIVPNVYYHYYQREKSITNDFSKKHIDDLIFSFKHLYQFIENNSTDPDANFMFKAYFDRGISSLIQMLFKNEPSIKQQKAYLIYLYETFSTNFSVKNAIYYLDINRIKKLFI